MELLLLYLICLPRNFIMGFFFLEQMIFKKYGLFKGRQMQVSLMRETNAEADCLTIFSKANKGIW